MDYENVLYEQRGPVTLITIDRPERMNAIDARTHRELIDAWDRFREDDDALVAVLTGAGDRAFCAGGDLKAAFADEDSAIDPSAAELAAHARGERPGVLGPSRWTDLYKPTIAAVNGVAYAGGLEWACWTDMCVADEHATFGVTCRRWNIGLADGGTQRLPRIVGFRRAMDLIVTGRVIDADEALAIGLVSALHPAGDLLAAAHAIADRIARNDAAATMATKRVFRAPRGSHPRADLEEQAVLFESPDKHRRMTDFLDRRGRTQS